MSILYSFINSILHKLLKYHPCGWLTIFLVFSWTPKISPLKWHKSMTFAPATKFVLKLTQTLTLILTLILALPWTKSPIVTFTLSFMEVINAEQLSLKQMSHQDETKSCTLIKNSKWLSKYQTLKAIGHICKPARSPWNFLCRWLLTEYSESFKKSTSSSY